MKYVAIPVLFALAAVTPTLASAHAHESWHPPCGVGAGGLPDPTETQACLASRYQPPKPKAAPAPPPPAKTSVGPVDSSASATPSSASPQATH